MDEIVLIDARLNCSGSSSEPSEVFGFGERYVRLVLPFKARSKCDGMFWRLSRISSSWGT